MAKINGAINGANKGANNVVTEMTAHEAAIAAEVNEMAKDENFKVEEPKLSPKNKKTLGIPQENKIAWVPFDSPKEYNEMINSIAKVRNVTVGKLLSDVLKAALAPMDADLKAEAATYVPSGGAVSKTVEKLAAMDDDKIEEFFNAEKEKMVKLLMRTGKTEEEARTRVFGTK